MSAPRQPESSRSSDEPLVGVPTHKVSTAAGAVVGGIAAGAAVGTVAGPIGTVIGAAVGAVAGGLGGDAIADSVDEARESAHWREQYRNRPYVPAQARYEDFGPAYDYGVTSYQRHRGRSFDEAEADLSRDWHSVRGMSTLRWEDARHAARDAWDRVHGQSRNARRLPSDEYDDE
jgi:hypothetical protein